MPLLTFLLTAGLTLLIADSVPDRLLLTVLTMLLAYSMLKTSILTPGYYGLRLAMIILFSSVLITIILFGAWPSISWTVIAIFAMATLLMYFLLVPDLMIQNIIAVVTGPLVVLLWILFT